MNLKVCNNEFYVKIYMALFSFNIFVFLFYSYICVPTVWAFICHGMHVKLRRKLVGVGSLSYTSRGLNSGH